ncbi:MAG TPA: ribonuclease H-like domain-containing protein [Bryobacteraceae bacterium]|nr:ribonuclease H-like domain-containing protein [Bryobacteraceae bacterium]
MEPLKHQLDLLRRRIARIDAHYAGQAGTGAQAPLPEGKEVETPAGRHWEFERLWPAHFRHGTADVGALSEMPADLLTVLDQAGLWESPVEKWAFLDTETTGLAGGSGTVAFLVGCGAITSRGFELRQFFMRDHGEEASLLHALEEWLAGFDVVITYNGKGFDVPLLETRFRMNRRKPCFGRLRHIDLLHSSRRIWRLALERCRLQDLESRILGVERHGDPGGAAIPQLYFDFLYTRNFGPLWPVFTHNAIDILSLACLTAIVPEAFRDPSRLTNAAEMVGLARWLKSEAKLEESLALMDAALDKALPDTLAWETLWHAADLSRKLGRDSAALARWTELSTAPNPFRARAYERLAIHYERKEKNPAMALEMTRAARAIEDSPGLLKREQRLAARLAIARPGRLL